MKIALRDIMLTALIMCRFLGIIFVSTLVLWVSVSFRVIWPQLVKIAFVDVRGMPVLWLGFGPCFRVYVCIKGFC